MGVLGDLADQRPSITRRHGIGGLDLEFRIDPFLKGRQEFLIFMGGVVGVDDQDVVALAAGGVLLMNRRIASTNMLRHVDGDLLVLLVGLFVVNAAFAQSQLPDKWLADLGTLGIRLDSMSLLFLVTAIASDAVGNTPAVMLLVPHVDTRDAGVTMALASGFSSNIVIFGSLATIIVADAAAKRGIPITFRAFTRAGVPVTLGTLLLAYLWLLATGA